jgi:predicted TIM-barrel fold metal-dependent hydrolase
MRSGFRIFDADTHFNISVESLAPHLESALQARLQEFKQFEREYKMGRAGQPVEPPYPHFYRFAEMREGEGWGGGGAGRRHLGEAAPRKNEERRFQQFMGARYPSVAAEDWDVALRLKEMDEEGVDTQLLVTGAPSHPDIDVTMGFIRGVHRRLDQVSEESGGRLKSMILVTPLAIEESIAEIKAWGDSPWAVSVRPDLPIDYPIDHPDLNPIWAAADEYGLCVVHHSGSAGYPGYRDLWRNPFIGRTASHPWGAMRAITAFMGGGLMDKFPNLKLCVLECGFGWLPFWTKRMEDQVIYMGYVAEDLQHTMTEYMTGGRFFSSIVLHEGADMVHAVNQLMGDHVLMFGSDYPHAESRFPDSVDLVIGWEGLSEDEKRKLLWDNPARCFNAE